MHREGVLSSGAHGALPRPPLTQGPLAGPRNEPLFHYYVRAHTRIELVKGTGLPEGQQVRIAVPAPA